MQTVVGILLIFVVGVRAPPYRSSKCRRRLPRLRMEVRDDNVIDLTYDFNDDTTFWPGAESGFVYKKVFAGFATVPERYFYSIGSYKQPEHLGTHMDAPIHFAENGNTASKVGFSNLIGPGYLINLKRNGERLDPDAAISIDDILNWEQNNEGGRIRSGGIVLLYTGYGDVIDNREAYYGTNLTGPDSVTDLHFPGLSPEAAAWLVTKRCIGAVGIDTSSIDMGQSSSFESHRILNGAGLPVFENVANLKEVEAQGKEFKVIALPQKITNGTGAPLRIIAVLD